MLGFLITALSGVIVAPVPKDAHFGSWTVACDNVRHCEAIDLPPDGSDDGWIMHVSRGSGAADSPKSDLGPAFDEGNVPGPYRLRIDGRLSDFVWFNGARHDAAVLAAIASARSVEVVDGKGKVLGTLPVAGAGAAMRWMDDRQKRAGTGTAIVARGPRSASDVPPPPVLPRILLPPVSNKTPRKLSAADVKAIQSKAGNLCEADRAAPTTYRLDAEHTLGIVGCMMGPYQGAALVVIIDEKGRWEPAPIEQPEPLPRDADAYDSYLLIEADYIEKERLLWMSAKGRGIGDCGEHATWAWDGKMFRLTAFLALNDCAGTEPGTMLSRWQTANDPLPKDW